MCLNKHPTVPHSEQIFVDHAFVPGIEPTSLVSWELAQHVTEVVKNILLLR